jgi:tripartite ATP-independent transporter DctM subunit
MAWDLAIYALLGLLILLGGGVWIAISLFIAGFVLMQSGLKMPAGPMLATSTWGYINNWTLTALPLFVWMGELLFRSRLSESLFLSLAPWMRNLPGGLLHLNVFGCGIFSAVSGSSTATTTTIGQMTLPKLRAAGYDENMSIGSLAASGTFGLLVPPSGMMIVYAFITETSVIKLFSAGILPAVMMAVLFSTFIAVRALVRPSLAPRDETSLTFMQKLALARHFLPMLLLIAGLMVAMYRGWATATEAAALGVLGALILLAVTGGLTWRLLKDATLSAVRTSCMILFVLAGAAFMTVAVGFSGLPDAIATKINALGLSPIVLIIALTLLYGFLGLFLDGLSMIVLTASTVIPMVQAAGIDPVWFGIYVVIAVEMSLITPPVGLNLFVLQAISGQDSLKVARAAFPYFLLMVASIALLIAFPQIALYLPSRL